MLVHGCCASLAVVFGLGCFGILGCDCCAFGVDVMIVYGFLVGMVCGWLGFFV